MSDEDICQAHKRMLKHIAYFFYTDKEFMQMDLYKRNQREFEQSLIQVAEELSDEEQLEFNLNDIRDLTKDNTQMLKMVSSLGIELDETEKEL